jgi:hypothetical protein
MNDIVIRPKKSADGKDFVGIEFMQDGSVNAVFPLGYNYTEENLDKLKKEIRKLFYTIKRYNRSNEGELYGTKTHSEKNRFPFADACGTVIRDFMQYGYYIERDVKYKRSPLGKINWKRTIAQVRPIIQDDSYPVYTDFVIRQNAKKTDNMISLIHEWCVYTAFTKLGCIFTTSTFTPRKPALKINEDKDNKYYISVIHDALKSTFNDRNKILFNAMIIMLRYGKTADKEPFLLGTKNFLTVWQELIDRSYGVSKERKNEFYPKAKWRFYGENNETEAGTLLPDTIMCRNGDRDEVFILDAKYYSFKNVPGADGINKQVAYGAYAAYLYPDAAVYNAFLIPYDFKADPHKLRTKNDIYNYEEEYIYIGFSFIEGPNEKSYELVLGILVDTKWLMENAGKVDKEKLAKFIINYYKEDANPKMAE